MTERLEDEDDEITQIVFIKLHLCITEEKKKKKRKMQASSLDKSVN